jgi:hypothetical protein
MLKKALADAKSLGCNLSVYLDFWLTTERSKIFKELYDDVLVSYYKKPIPITINFGYQHAQLRDYCLEQGGRELCQKSPRFQKYALDLVKESIDLGFSSILIDGGSAWNTCYGENHGHVSPDDTIEGAFEWMSEASKIVKHNDPQGYIIGEAPDSFNSQLCDIYLSWWQPGKGSGGYTNSEVLRYTLPEMILSWGIDQLDRDIIPEVFAKGHHFATMIYNLDGMLSDHPEFAAHIHRLSVLKKETLEYVAHGRFLDKKGLDIDGGIGYVYSSDAGMAVTIGNKEKKENKIKVRFSNEDIKGDICNSKLHIEGTKAIDALVQKNGDHYEVELTLPPYGSSIWCIPK